MRGEASNDDLSLGVTIRGFVPQQRLFGRYILIRILGRGGMGIVWLARDEQLGRDVALKFLPELIAHDASRLADLKREATRSLDLTHRNIVRIYDFVQDTQSAGISMEYVNGLTLSALRSEKSTAVFTCSELRQWIPEICEALEYAHRFARVVHSDIKPSNIMVSTLGTAKVADFGIARSLSDSMTMLTRGGSTSGTLVYMSPQQLDGERASHLDDIYSLGATLYDLLTSKPPFYRGQVDRQIRERVPLSLQARRDEFAISATEEIPASWEKTVAACLAKNPSERPQSALEVSRRLEATRDETNYPAPPLSLFREITTGAAPPQPAQGSQPKVVAETRRRPHRWSGVRITVVALALLIVGGGSLYLAKRNEAPEQDRTVFRPHASPASTALASQQVTSVSPAPSPTSTESGLADTSTTDARNDLEGIPAGSTFGISELNAADSPGADATTRMTLKISVKARPSVPIDHTKVKIQVFFYDTIDNKEVALTDADVSYQWLTPNHDWKETNPEVLAVTYLRAKVTVSSPAAVTPLASKKKKTPASQEGDRKYLGYIVRIYYNDQLQTVRADPTKLLNLFPPPISEPSS